MPFVLHFDYLHVSSIQSDFISLILDWIAFQLKLLILSANGSESQRHDLNWK